MPNPTTEETPAPEAQATEEEASNQQPANDPDKGSEENPSGETPPGEGSEEETPTLSHEDALSALSKVRKAEARMRTRLREVEEKLAAAKTPEEYEAAVKKVSEDNAADARALIVENVALKAGLPEELADALKGETREELEAHAKVLAKFVPKDDEPTDDPDLSGGLEPGNSAEAFDPAAIAQRVRRQRNRGR